MCSATHQESLATYNQHQALTNYLEVHTSFLDAVTATYSSQTEGNWTRDDQAQSSYGSTTRDVRARSSTTCQTAGECICGWCHRERFLYVIRVDKEENPRLLLLVLVLNLAHGSTLLPHTTTIRAMQSCI